MKPRIVFSRNRKVRRSFSADLLNFLDTHPDKCIQIKYSTI